MREVVSPVSFSCLHFQADFQAMHLDSVLGWGWGGVPDTEANETLKGLPPSSGIVLGFAT